MPYKIIKTILFLSIGLTFICSCTVLSEQKIYKDNITSREYRLNVKVNGSALTSEVLLDDSVLITQSWPPFVNSRDEKTIYYNGDKIKSVLRVIKGIGNSTVQVYVYINDKEAAEFYF